MKSIQWMLLGLAAAMPLVGCGAAVDGAPPSGEGPVAQEEQTLQPIATIDVDPDTTLSFFEPEPGMVVMMEKGKAGMTSVFKRFQGLDAAAMYEKVAGTQAPAILRKAVDLGKTIAATPRTAEQLEARAQLHRDESAAVSTSTHDDLGESGHTLKAADDSYFWLNNCEYPAYNKRNRWRSHIGNDTHQVNDAGFAVIDWFSITGAFRGTIKWRPLYTWSAGVYGEVTEGGEIHYQHSDNGWLDFDIKIAYSNAANDVYDSCIGGDW